MSTSKNWEKQYKDWYFNTFMRACAAYAVALDFSWPENSDKRNNSSWNLKKALEYEATFGFPDPALAKFNQSGSAPAATNTAIGGTEQEESAYQKARDAFRAAGGVAGNQSAVDSAVKKAIETAKKKTEWTDNDWNTNGKLMRNSIFYPSSHDYKFSILEPILKTITDPNLGFPGVWMIAQKYKFWNSSGAPDAEIFNVLLTSIVNWGATGGLAKVFAPLKELSKNGWSNKYSVPLVYMVPFGGMDIAPFSQESIVAAAPVNQEFETQYLGPQSTAWKPRYVIGESFLPTRESVEPGSFVVGHPSKFAGLIDGDRATTTTAKEMMWNPYQPWSGLKNERFKAPSVTVGSSRPHLGKREIPEVAKLLARGPISKLAGWPTGGIALAYARQANGILFQTPQAFYGQLMSMIYSVGKSSHKTSTGKSNYDQIVYEILWGLQDPKPPGPTKPSGGGSSRSYTPTPAPKNVGKRKLKPGEIHAVDLQCVLLEKIQSLAQAREDSPYKNVGTIEGGQPGNIVSKLNHGAPPAGKGGVWPPTAGGPDSEAYTLQNMCPDLWALMVPHLELYRVNYLKKGPKDKERPSLVPVSEIQLPFSNFLDQSDVNEITAGTYGRVGGAGIKSFTWSLDGTQPAEVDNLISAQLTMHFQSVYDLFRHNEVPTTGEGPSGKFAAGIPNQAGYLDLIIGSGTQGRPQSETANESQEGAEAAGACESLKSNVYEGENFRIKVIAGWATPPGFTQMNIPGYTTAELEYIQAAITASRTALYLQIVSHAINFQQDGTLELVIDYQASMSGITRSPRANIFIGKELYEEEMTALEEAEAGLVSEEVKAMEAAESAGTAEEVGAQTSRDERKKEILAKQIALMRKSRAAKYKEFLRSLNKHKKVRGLLIPTKELLNPLKAMTPEDRAVAAKERYAADITLASEAAAERATARLEKQAEDIANDVASDEPEEENKTLQAMYAGVGIFPKSGAKNTLIPFMYLGDLIDAILESRLPHLVNEDFAGTPIPPMQMMLGNVEMVNPLLAYQINNITVDCGAGTDKVKLALAQIDPFRFRQVSGIFEYINIGSLPISLDKFNEWFVNTVIKEKVDSYPLLNFVRDICSGLISSAYSSVCFEEVFQFHVTFNTSTFRMADAYRGKSPSLDELAHSARKAGVNDRARFTPESTKPPSIPTSVLYSVDSRPMNGDRIADMQEGVYHYFLGGRCGLAKEIVFERQDMPFYREARISKDGSLGAQQLKELYTVNMAMMGNTLHKNGTYVYIDPIAIGAGSSRAIGGIPNIARLIGLGGYFLVNSVSSEISPMGFSTQVNAMQEQSVFDADDDTKIVAMTMGGVQHLLDEEGHIELQDEDIDWEHGSDPPTGGGSDEDPGPPDITGDSTGTVIDPAPDFQAMKAELMAAGLDEEAAQNLTFASLGALSVAGTEAFTDEDQAALDAYSAALAAADEA